MTMLRNLIFLFFQLLHQGSTFSTTNSLVPTPFEQKLMPELMDEQTLPHSSRVVFGALDKLENITIKYDTKNKIIYILITKYKDHRSVHYSKLYFSAFESMTFQRVDLIFEGRHIFPTQLYVSQGLAIAYAKPQYTMCISSNNGVSWSFNKWGFWFVNFFIHPKLSHKIVALSLLNRVHLINRKGEYIALLGHDAQDVTWDINSPTLYFIRCDYYSKELTLFIVPNHRKMVFIAKDVVKYNILKDYVMFITEKDKARSLHFYNSSSIRTATFPKHLNLTDATVVSITNQVLLVLRNATNQIYVYSAWLNEFKFSRLSNPLYEHHPITTTCFELQHFEEFPGLLLSNIEKTIGNVKIKFTAISFNNGAKWAHLLVRKSTYMPFCEWPQCYLRLNLGCYGESLHLAVVNDEANPSLMIGYGTLYSRATKGQSGLFVSIDAGFMWIMAPKTLKSIEIFSGGSLLVGVMHRFYSLLVSSDLGTTWFGLPGSNPTFISYRTLSVSSLKTQLLTTIVASEVDKTWSVVYINFSSFLEIDCKTKDFELFTPENHNHSQCFQGLHGFTYRKKPNTYCYFNSSAIPVGRRHSCPCREDDFGCEVGFAPQHGLCREDPDDALEIVHHPCILGNFVFDVSKIRKHSGDQCIESERWDDQVYDICGFTENDTTISVLIGSTIQFILLENDLKNEWTDFPLSLTKLGQVKGYHVDFLHRCLYVLSKTGIVQLCYSRRKQTGELPKKLVLKDPTIKGFKIDQHSNIVYYYNKTTISAMTIDSKFKKLLYKSDLWITYMNIIPEVGKLLAAEYDSKYSSHSLNFMPMSGSLISFVFEIDTAVQVATYDHHERAYKVFTEKRIFTMSGHNLTFKKRENNAYRVLDVAVDGGNFYYLTTQGVQTKNAFIYKNYIEHGQIHHRKKPNQLAACSLAHCDSFCFPLDEDRYECGCPESMFYDPKLGHCVCDPLNQNCAKCRANQFQCENGVCVELLNRCDRFDDCGDNSDEADCETWCEIDDLLCDNATKCVDFGKLCDGVEHCLDGKDELHCHEIDKCSETEFRCFDNACIRREQHCDGVPNCHDFSDEADCNEPCKYFEFECTSGQCVMKNQVCDGNFDCPDMSDERDCNKIALIGKNASCYLRCDNRCVAHSRICDHIQDCADGSDELDCGHEIKCPKKSGVPCASDFTCYNLTQACDGFFDCSDRSDELYCEESTKCTTDYHFRCSDRQCISINKYCDGVNDCKDLSDEKPTCWKSKQIKKITLNDFGKGSIRFKWTVSSMTAWSEPFNVSILSNSPSDSVKDVKTSLDFYDVEGLKICRRYTFMVKLFNTKIGRYIQFTYKPSRLSPPWNVNFVFHSRVLSWGYQIHVCIPTVFFIQCLVAEKIVYQNFSYAQHVIIPSNFRGYCRLSACYIKVFNHSCSSFSPDIRLTSTTFLFNFKLAMIIIAIMLLLVFIILFLRKYYHFNRLKLKLASYGVNWIKYNISTKDNII